MQKLNKKGFTLVELLVVIVILVVIMAVAVPSITSTSEKSKEKQKNKEINLIISAAESEGKNLYIPEGEKAEYSLLCLICNGKITREEVLDPFDSSKTLCGYIEGTRESVKWVEVSPSDARYESSCVPENYSCEPCKKLS